MVYALPRHWQSLPIPRHLEALVIPPDAMWSTLMLYTQPFPPDLFQHARPYHEVLFSCKPHRPGCHQWHADPCRHPGVMHCDLADLQPDVIVERCLDAKYYLSTRQMDS